MNTGGEECEGWERTRSSRFGEYFVELATLQAANRETDRENPHDRGGKISINIIQTSDMTAANVLFI